MLSSVEASGAGHAPLTRCERKVLARIVLPYRLPPPRSLPTTRDLAGELGWSPKMVHVIVHRLRRKRPGWVVNKTPWTRPCSYGLSDEAQALLR